MTIGVALIVLGALTMRQRGGGMLIVGIVLTVAGSMRKQSKASRPTSYGLPPRIPGPDGVRLPPIPFTPLAGRPVMTGTFCSQCGTQGRSGDACCRRCGASRSSLVVQPFQECLCTSCGQTHTAPMEQFCRRCGQTTV
jgi:hypothetical protein